MHKRVWQSLLLSAKLLQFRFATWQNRREIARAYRREWHWPTVDRTTLARVRLAVGAAVLIAGVVVGAYLAIRGLRAASVKAVRTAPAPLPERDAQTPSAAPSAETSAEPQASAVPLADAVYELSDSVTYAIVANKATRRLYLCRSVAGAFRIESSYAMAIGRGDGQKQNEGDGRTPEGMYCIIGRKEQSDLAPIYGPCAFVLNYPNDDDREAGRTGNGIWIHGTAPDSARVSTRGCLVLDNGSLRALKGVIGAGIGTPVVIVNQPGADDPVGLLDRDRLLQARRAVVREYSMRRDAFLGTLYTWKEAWASRDLATYAACYDTAAFTGDGMGWRGWRERKQRTFDLYRHIEVRLSDIVIFDATDTTAVVGFAQHYASDQVSSLSAKRLYLGNHGGGWKIVKEATIPREELAI